MRFLKETLDLFVNNIRWLSVIWITTFFSITSCAHLIRSPEGANPALAVVLETKIFVQTGKQPDFEYVEFDVPRAGKAIIRVVNGARVGAPFSERLEGAEITLNGVAIIKPKDFCQYTNVLELWISLVKGTNQLGVMLSANTGKQLSVSIDAAADSISLSPVRNALVANKDLLHAKATVTALGLPVENADVVVEMVGAGLKKTAPTGPSGSTSVLLEVETVGADKLRATVVDSQPTLVDETPIRVLAKRGIVLEQRSKSLRLAAGSEALVEFTIDMQSVDGAIDHITLASVVAPGDDGLTVELGFPAEGLDVTSPRRVPISAKATARKPGFYTVATTATIKDSGETFTVVLPVDVVKPDTPEPLLLGIPIAMPSHAAPNTPTTVIFRAQVDGTSKPPEVLFLDELDLAGKPLQPAIAKLLDEGKGEDTVARDRIYSGRLEIDRLASELRFRVRAAYFGKEVVSGATVFLVTLPPREAKPGPLVPLHGKRSRVYANQIEIKLIPGVSPKDVIKIVASIDGTVVGVIPPLRIYLIEFPGDGKANGAMKAIDTVSTFSQVESAAPNFEMVPNAISFNDGTDCEPTTPATCPNDGSQQWYLTTIGARDAWNRAGGGSTSGPFSAKIAVVDAGVNCDQGDLFGRCTTSGSDVHATQVAGIIAANANNSNGIAGIAWNTEMESITAGVGDGFAFKNEITTISGDVKVINVSQQVHLFDTAADVTEKGYLREAVCHAVDAGKLEIVAGGNIVIDDDELSLYPARLDAETSHTCAGPENRVMVSQLLTVGGSNQSDGRATWGTFNKSSKANYLDIYAPGVGITTITSPSGMATVNGTSFASAQVSGAAAVLWAHNVFAEPSGQTRAKAIHDRLKTTGDLVSLICASCRRLNLDAAVNVPSFNGPVAEFDPTGNVTLTGILGPQRSWAQTFRPSNSTLVRRVGLVFVADGNPTPAELGDLTIEIRTTTGSGIPSTTVLGSVTIPGAMITSNINLFDSTFTEHTLSAPINLTAGQQYAIVATTNSTVVDSPFGPYKWSGQHSINPYADGNSFVMDDTPDSPNQGVWDNKGGANDLGFRVIAGP